MRTLHIWGGIGHLPSIDPECIATLGYVIHNGSLDKWKIITEYDPSFSPNGDFPALSDGEQCVAGYQAILDSIAAFKTAEEANFGKQEEADLISWSHFIQQRGQALLDLYLYVSSNNYWETISPAFTKILPWYANYVIPPARRKVATARTSHLGIRSLDLDTAQEAAGDENKTAFKSDSPAPNFAAQSSPEQLLNRQKSLNWLRSQTQSDTFRLHQLNGEFFGPLENLLDDRKFLMTSDNPTSLDYLALGYLSLMLYAPVPQPWLADALRKRFPKLKAYTERMYKHTFKSPDLRWNEIVSKASAPTASDSAKFLGQSLLDIISPWKQTITVDPIYKSKQSSVPVAQSSLYSISFSTLAFSAALIGGVAFAATKLVAASSEQANGWSSHESDYLQPTRLSDLGEAGATLAALSHQMELEARGKERASGVTIMEVDVENGSREVGRQVVMSR